MVLGEGDVVDPMGVGMGLGAEAGDGFGVGMRGGVCDG